MPTLREMAERAKAASRRLARLGRAQKDQALAAIARGLRDATASIGAANASDLERAREAGLSAAMIDRLTMGPKGVESTAKAVEHVMTLPDPVGARHEMRLLANGLLVGRQRLPLGVIAIVYESRPNVTVDAASLCLKSGNAVLLRGGKEARETNARLGEILREALSGAGIDPEVIQIVPATDRESIRELVGLSDLVDLAIPRGGEGLIRFVSENARVPVIKHYKGVCHLYLDKDCDLEKATRLAINGKVQRPGVCNALECLLVAKSDAARLLPTVCGALRDQGVEVRACPAAREFLPFAVAATEEDWGAEYLDKIIAVKVVDDMDGAMNHVDRFGSNHTEVICTESHTRAQRWIREVDASCVCVNASSRFNDGGELGLGAEIGISTSKLHAYGPMGLESLTGEKWVVLGDGQVRS